MSQWSAPVIDCDGHLVESIPEMAEYLDPIARKMATNPDATGPAYSPASTASTTPARRRSLTSRRPRLAST